jgi:hypothetical protein
MCVSVYGSVGCGLSSRDDLRRIAMPVVLVLVIFVFECGVACFLEGRPSGAEAPQIFSFHETRG